MTEKDLVRYLRKHFTYHKKGTLTRSDRKNSNGSLDKDGYLIIKIKGKQYKAHRLVYAMFYGELPKGEIDHINRVRTDNRIENLRIATRQLNVDNTTKKRNPDTGEYGVHIDRTDGLKKKYTTKIGSKTYRFYTIEEAVKKRREELNGSLQETYESAV